MGSESLQNASLIKSIQYRDKIFMNNRMTDTNSV